MSILSAHDVRLEDISDLMGHSSTLVTETVYRHEIRPALTKGATAMNRILKANAAKPALALADSVAADQRTPAILAGAWLRRLELDPLRRLEVAPA